MRSIIPFTLAHYGFRTALLIRSDRKDAYFLGSHYLAFAMSLGPHNIIEQKVSISSVPILTG
jgi:hypothetical protein